MAIEIPPSYGQVSWSGAMPGSDRPWTVTCGFAWIDSTMADVLDYLAQAWADTLLTIQSNLVSFDSTKVLMNVAGTLVGGETTFASGIGAASGPVGMSNSAVLVRKVTERIGRRYQGRMFIPGIRESGVDDGASLTSSEVILWRGVVDDLYTAMTDGTELLQPVILHDEALATEPTPILSFDTQRLLATQRRRLRK